MRNNVCVIWFVTMAQGETLNKDLNQILHVDFVNRNEYEYDDDDGGGGVEVINNAHLILLFTFENESVRNSKTATAFPGKEKQSLHGKMGNYILPSGKQK